jgi:hypothetical protein
MVNSQSSLPAGSQAVSATFSSQVSLVLLVQVAGLMRYGDAHSEHAMPKPDVVALTQNSHAVRWSFGILPGPHATQTDCWAFATLPSPLRSHASQSPPSPTVPAGHCSHWSDVHEPSGKVQVVPAVQREAPQPVPPPSTMFGLGHSRQTPTVEYLPESHDPHPV